jgi:hypothetical protein
MYTPGDSDGSFGFFSFGCAFANTRGWNYFVHHASTTALAFRTGKKKSSTIN